MSRLVHVIRTLMVCAAVLSSVPSFEGLVLCWCGGARVEIESGTSRCADAPEVTAPLAAAAPVLTDSHCGTCVDLPLRNPGAGIGRTRPASSPQLDATPALLPVDLPSTAPVVTVHASASNASRHSASFSSTTLSPLRC